MLMNTIFFSPHPPVIVPEIGKGDERAVEKTTEGLRRIALKLAEEKPEAVIYITPHGNMFADAVCLLDAQTLSGDFGQFDASVSFEKRVSKKLMENIIGLFKEKGVPYIALNEREAQKYGVNAKLDHGAMVPMYFIDQEYGGYDIVHISPGFLDVKELYAIGGLLKQAVEQAGIKTTVVASGDLSHCLKEDGPYGYTEEGERFEEAVYTAFSSDRPNDILRLDSHTVRKAGECGLKPFALALGMADGFKIHTTVFSHEAPFGVGYMTAYLSMSSEKEAQKDDAAAQDKHDPYIALACAAISHYVLNGSMLSGAEYSKTADAAFVREMENTRAGAFVSIHKNENLRGCIGTILPTAANLAEEIIYSATQACGFDPRFYPVTAAELRFLDVKVDVLKPPERVTGIDELNEKRYGVIVSKGGRRGLLLPNLDGVDSVAEQLSIAKQKAGIRTDDENVEIMRFEVIRHEE